LIQMVGLFGAWSWILELYIQLYNIKPFSGVFP
jgi:hypothetical protein